MEHDNPRPKVTLLPPDVTLRQIEVFVALMRGLTTAEVSEMLDISQPAVSLSLRQLETTLDLTLFDRSGRKLSPTSNARALFDEASSVLSAMRGFSHRAQDLSSGVTGRLRVMSTPPLGYSYAPEALAQFCQAYGDVAISYDVRTISEVYLAVQTGEVDLGLGVYSTRPDSLLHITPLHRTRMVAMVPKTSALADHTEITPADLEEHSFIGLQEESILGALVRDAFHDSRCRYAPKTQVRFAATAAALAERQLGVALVDTYSASSYAFSNVTRVPFVPAIDVSACTVTRRGVPHSHHLKAFVAMLSDILHRKEASLPVVG